MNYVVSEFSQVSAGLVLGLLGFAALLAILLRAVRRRVVELEAQAASRYAEGYEAALETLPERIEEAKTLWILVEAPKIRKGAIKKSTAVVKGKVAEHMVPYMDGWDYNPRDARFLGSPIDFVVFDGLTEGKIEFIWLVEVKTGKSRVTARQRQVRECCELGDVAFQVVRIGSK